MDTGEEDRETPTGEVIGGDVNDLPPPTYGDRSRVLQRPLPRPDIHVAAIEGPDPGPSPGSGGNQGNPCIPGPILSCIPDV